MKTLTTPRRLAREGFIAASAPKGWRRSDMLVPKSETVAPFPVTPRQLEGALAYAIGISLFIPWTFLPGYTGPFLGLIVAAVVLPTLALVLPMRGLRAVVLPAKQEAIEKLDAEVRAIRELAMKGEPTAQARTVFLLSYRNRLEAVAEWPLDFSGVRRFGLYLLIPLGSWVASALVERALDTALN